MLVAAGGKKMGVVGAARQAWLEPEEGKKKGGGERVVLALTVWPQERIASARGNRERKGGTTFRLIWGKTWNRSVVAPKQRRPKEKRGPHKEGLVRLMFRSA